jgi:hypothetical protein
VRYIKYCVASISFKGEYIIKFGMHLKRYHTARGALDHLCYKPARSNRKSLVNFVSPHHELLVSVAKVVSNIAINDHPLGGHSAASVTACCSAIPTSARSGRLPS